MPDQPLFTALKIESLAKWFEPTDHQKASGRMRFMVDLQDATSAAAILAEAARQLTDYQTLLAAGAKPERIGHPGRGRGVYRERRKA